MTKTQPMSKKMQEMIAQNDEIQEALDLATRDALLSHARNGNYVVQGDGNGGIRKIYPKEIYARYGFDENGKPLPQSAADA